MRKMLLLAMALGAVACERTASVASTQESQESTSAKAWRRVGELEVENATLRTQIEDLRRQVPAATEKAGETVAEFVAFARLTAENQQYKWPYITTAKLGAFGRIYSGSPAPRVVYVVSSSEMLIQFSAVTGPATLWVRGIPTAGVVDSSAAPVEHYLYSFDGNEGLSGQCGHAAYGACGGGVCGGGGGAEW